MEQTSKLTMRTLLVLLSVLGILSGCSPKPGITPETKYVSIERAARVPAGTVRYCWEEPMVEFEPNGPGLDEQGHWYHPAYLAVREVRQGRWRPCRPVPSEITGDLKNER